MKLEEYLDLAADSLAKASVHEPVGNPAGPGLWKHKGWQLPAYIQHIANDLREKRGMSTSQAVATAVAAVKRWAAGVGKVDSGTKAAAKKALTEWEGLKSKAAALSALEKFEDEDGIALTIEACDLLSSNVNFDAEIEGGVHLAVPTNIGRLEEAEGAILDYIKNEKDMDDKIEAKGLLERVHRLIAKDRAENAAGHPLPAYSSAHFAEDTALAEMFFADESDECVYLGDDGLLYKTILREGKWKYSPLDGQGPPVGITVVKGGKSDPSKMVVSMSEVLKNFEKGAIEHVTVPTSHANKVHENTGFTRELRMAKDKKGRWVLEAGVDFTEPEIKAKAERGTIANTSAGLVFNYIDKESGTKYPVVLEHVALTNRPWLNDMQPFGVAASQEGGMTVMSFSEDGLDLEGLMGEIAEGVDDGSPDEGVELDADSTKNVTYADPGYQEDGKARCALDSEEHIRAAWSYVNQADSGAQYSAEQLGKVKTRIKGAMKRIGATVEMSDEQLTAQNEEALRALLGHDEQEVDAVDDTEKSLTDLLKEKFGLSEEEIAAKLVKADALELSDKEREVKDYIKAQEGDKKSPAVLKVAEALLMSDEGTLEVSLSEDGKDKKVTLSDAVKALVAASPAVNLEDTQVTEEETTEGGAPKENAAEEVELSAEIANEARRLFLYEGKSEDEAVKLAQEKFGDTAGK